MGDRVKVWKTHDPNNPRVGYLGEGEIIGLVPVLEVFGSKEEYIRSLKTFVSKVLKKMGMPYEGVYFEENFRKHLDTIPPEERKTVKIRLDDGRIVFGTHVFWRFVRDW